MARIGPITAQTASDLGFTINVMAREYTIEGLVEAIIEDALNSTRERECSDRMYQTAVWSSNCVEAIKHRGQDRDIPPQLLQFSATNRPLVEWNMTNRCNLKCMHCYIKAEDRKYQDELTTEEAKAFICDLAQMKVPVLLFSGGEPLAA